MTQQVYNVVCRFKDQSVNVSIVFQAQLQSKIHRLHGCKLGVTQSCLILINEVYMFDLFLHLKLMQTASSSAG